MTVKVCLVFWVSRHKGIGHDDLPLPDVVSEELLLAGDTAPDDIWVAFVKNCFSRFLIFEVVFAKPCYPLILVCCISLKEKAQQTKIPESCLSVGWQGFELRMRGCHHQAGSEWRRQKKS